MNNYAVDDEFGNQVSAGLASYSAANQTTDFGGTQAAGTLAVRVYQISEAVGRGYAGSATV